MNVTQTMLGLSTPEQAMAYLLDSSYQFEESEIMYACAEKAGLSLLSFQEVYGHTPRHRYDLLALEGLQMEGGMPRVTTDETLNTAQHRLNVEVSKGRLAEAARMGLDRLARSVAMDPPRSVASATKAVDDISQAVSGSHYNDVVPGYQYMEMMQHMLDGKEGVEAHLLGQTYKYLMRSGKKDDVEQEYRKARWYLNCLVKYKQTGEIDPNNND
jgi:hypothetical protein